MPAEIHFDPDVFHGELTANRAQVFVRWQRAPEFADCSLHGYVHGPRCEFAHTLPAKYTLTDLGAGPTLLAHATITDPCLWTSDLPQIYDVHIELRRGSEVLAREQRMLGLRGIGARASEGQAIGHLIREGKVWVPRGVDVALLSQNAGSVVDQLRQELLVGICTSPPLDLLVEASRRGAYLMANLSATLGDFEAAVRNLARWPAVMLAIVHGGEQLDGNLQKIAPNLVLAQPLDSATVKAFQPAPWAAAIVAEITSDEPVMAINLPILAARTSSINNAAAAENRAACDRLQRDLTSSGQFAGYLIKHP